MLGTDSNEWFSIFGAAPSTLKVTPTNADDSDVSVAATVGLMGAHARLASTSPQVLSAVQEIQETLGIGAKDRELAERVWEYVKGKVRFVEDETILKRLFNVPGNSELLITPDRLLTMPVPMGDCDDFSTLTCSLLMALGIQCDFVTIAADADKPETFSHVFCMATLDNGERVALDTSHGKYFGWESPRQFRRFQWPVFTQGEIGMINKSGLHGLGMPGDFGGETLAPTDTNTINPDFGGGSFGGGGFNWGGLTNLFAMTGAKIAIAQFGQPQMQPGTFIRNADGSIQTNVPGAGGGFSSGGYNLGGSSNTLLLIGAVLLGLVVFSKK